MKNETLNALQGRIDIITEYINWCQRNLQATESTDFANYLIDQRRVIKRIKRAAMHNPAIAAYGESQKGKSYVVTSLLSSPGRPLSILDENGKYVNFIDNFNRKTTDQESTGVITRFTTDVVSNDPLHPIKIQTLSVADLITMLANYYMTAVKGYTPYQIADLNIKGQQLVQKYQNMPIVQHILSEDEVGDIQEFLNNNNKTQISAFRESQWFRNMTLVVTRIPWENLAEEFSPLWFEDEVFTNLLQYTLTMYQTLDWANELYIDTKPVLNDGNDHAETLMSVEVLTNKEYGIRVFYDKKGQITRPVAVVAENGRVVTVDKAFLSFITAEVDYHINEEHLQTPITFHQEGIRETKNNTKENILSMLSGEINTPISRDFLFPNDSSSACFDLLDFPGSRVVDTNQKENIINDLSNIVLREKVAYLFNKYSFEKRLSVLLLCHDEANSDKTIHEPLANWVNNYVGETPMDRASKINRYGNISPLFLISTKYNRSLVIEKNKEKKIDTMVFTRRLQKLLDEVIKVDTYHWFSQWMPNATFDNTFLLRDFKYSSLGPGCSGLFDGYSSDGTGTPESKECNIEERKQLKEVFLNDEYVKKFFLNPELAWDVSSTIGNDGSYILFKKLSQISKYIESARTYDFEDLANKCFENAYKKMLPKHHSEENSEKLAQSVKEAKRLNGAMSNALNRHEDFFGRFIQYLQFTPYYASEVFMNLVNSTKLNAEASVKEYEVMVQRIKESGDSFIPGNREHNLQVLEDVFGSSDPTDSIFEGVEFDKLFSGSFAEQRSASRILARELINGWLTYISSAESTTYFSQIGFASDVLSEFLNRFKAATEHAAVIEHIADAISEYVDYTHTINVPVIPLIADVAANVYNGFVMDMGYSYLSKEEQEAVLKQCEENKLKLTGNYGIIELEDSTDAEIRQHLFNSLQDLGRCEGGQLLRLPSYKNMVQWIELTTIAYLINFGAEDWGYSREENAKLGELLNNKYSNERKQ